MRGGFDGEVGQWVTAKMTFPIDSYSFCVARLAGRFVVVPYFLGLSQNPNFPFPFSRKPVLQRVRGRSCLYLGMVLTQNERLPPSGRRAGEADADEIEGVGRMVVCWWLMGDGG